MHYTVLVRDKAGNILSYHELKSLSLAAERLEFLKRAWSELVVELFVKLA